MKTLQALLLILIAVQAIVAAITRDYDLPLGLIAPCQIDHPLLRALQSLSDASNDRFVEASQLIFDLARIADGGRRKDLLHRRKRDGDNPVGERMGSGGQFAEDEAEACLRRHFR